MTFWKYAAVVGGMICVAPAVRAQQTPAQPEKPGGQVVFSRSAGDAAQQTPAAAQEPAPPPVTDAERAAVTFTGYDLQVHLQPHGQSMEVQARVTVRNDSSAPLREIALQLSSTLNFEQAAMAGQRLRFAQTTVNSDVDHTGQLHEAGLVLPTALAPGASVALNVAYGGTVPLSAKRLLALGTPGDLAEASDWDRIGNENGGENGDEFVGLRGFGNVAWYPVSSVPVAFGDGAKLFEEIGAAKQRQAEAMVSLQVTEEFFDQAPNVAILDGKVVALDKPLSMPTGAFPGVIACSLPATRLGFAAPSMFLARRTATEGSGTRVLAREQDAANAQGYLTAASMVKALVEQWLGAAASHPGTPGQREKLTVFDLPEPDDAAAEERAVLLTPVVAAEPEKLAPAMSHELAHAYFESPREWLNEGVASFVGTLWIEQTQGRTAALEHLEAERGALAVAEPGSPGESMGENLIDVRDAIYYRTKATYVLWMLRDLAGDAALQKALKTYDPAQDTRPDYFESLVERASGRNLKWFFDDWVYRDRGLPDLSIANVYPTPGAQANQFLVAVEVANAGYAAAEVPVTVRSAGSTVTERVLAPGRGQVTHRILINGPPMEVDVNDGTVPEVGASIHRRELLAPSASPQ